MVTQGLIWVFGSNANLAIRVQATIQDVTKSRGLSRNASFWWSCFTRGGCSHINGLHYTQGRIGSTNFYLCFVVIPCHWLRMTLAADPLCKKKYLHSQHNCLMAPPNAAPLHYRCFDSGTHYPRKSPLGKLCSHGAVSQCFSNAQLYALFEDDEPTFLYGRCYSRWHNEPPERAKASHAENLQIPTLQFQSLKSNDGEWLCGKNRSIFHNPGRRMLASASSCSPANVSLLPVQCNWNHCAGRHNTITCKQPY